MKTMATTIVRGTFAFRRIFLTYIVVLLISGLVYAVFSVYPSINSILEDSRSTPWGIVTSIFAHSSLGHITLNMSVLLVFVFLFAFCNCTFPSQDKRKIESFFLVSSFGSAMVSNVLWLLVTSNSSVGASGLVYAAEGNLLGFSLANGLQFLYFSKLKAQKPSIVFIVIMNLLIFVLFAYQIFLNPAIFLSIGQGINIIAHGVSFLLCFFISILWYRLSGKVSVLE
jgi:membrane associated rhomboid family serine protease